MNADYTYIEKLLQRFFDGESTLDEEAKLVKFFSSDDVPSEWMQYKKVFQYIESLQPENQKRHFAWQNWLLWCGAAAAIIAIVGAIGLRFFNPVQETVLTQPQTASVEPAHNPSPTPDTVINVVQVEPAKLTSSASALAQSKKRTKHQRAKTSTVSTSADSAEIVHTEGELEKAEQEYIADRLLLEQELRRNQPSTTTRSGWVTTSLNIQ